MLRHLTGLTGSGLEQFDPSRLLTNYMKENSKCCTPSNEGCSTFLNWSGDNYRALITNHRGRKNSKSVPRDEYKWNRSRTDHRTNQGNRESLHLRNSKGIRTDTWDMAKKNTQAELVLIQTANTSYVHKIHLALLTSEVSSSLTRYCSNMIFKHFSASTVWSGKFHLDGVQQQCILFAQKRILRYLKNVLE